MIKSFQAKMRISTQNFLI